jgi:hypothetical protein
MIIGNLRRQILQPQKVSHNTRMVYRLQRGQFHQSNLMVHQLPKETFLIFHSNLIEFQHRKDQFHRNHNNQIKFLLRRNLILQLLTKPPNQEVKVVKDNLQLHLSSAKEDLLQFHLTFQRTKFLPNQEIHKIKEINKICYLNLNQQSILQKEGKYQK